MASVEQFYQFSRESLEKYNFIQEEVLGDSNKDNVTLFMLAMAYGFANERRITEFRKSGTGPRTGLNHNHFSLMTALQLSVSGDPEIMLDQSDRLDVAGQYAEGGIRLLYERLSNPRVADKKLEFLKIINEAIEQSE